MRFSAMQARLALTSVLLLFGSNASAGEPELFDVERRFAAIERQVTGRYPVQPAAFVPEAESGSTHLPAPRELADSPEGEEVGAPCSCRDAGYREKYVCQCDGECESVHGVYFAEVQHMWLRSHVMENAVGKLSERFEYSPRIVIGYEDKHGIGGRIRYWHYDQMTENLTDPLLPIRFEMGVLDIEGTSRFGTDRAELVVSGGFRWTDARITLVDAPVANDMPGITFAADLRVILCRERRWEWASITGARYSLSGGDWEGAANGFLAPNHDDNVTVNAFYGGFEYIQHYKGYDAFARIAFEVQNWQSDVASQTAGADSINFMGPGVHAGLIF
jgi:hypothetical protein